MRWPCDFTIPWCCWGQYLSWSRIRDEKRLRLGFEFVVCQPTGIPNGHAKYLREIIIFVQQYLMVFTIQFIFKGFIWRIFSKTWNILAKLIIRNNIEIYWLQSIKLFSTCILIINWLIVVVIDIPKQTITYNDTEIGIRVKF